MGADHALDHLSRKLRVACTPVDCCWRTVLSAFELHVVHLVWSRNHGQRRIRRLLSELWHGLDKVSELIQSPSVKWVLLWNRHQNLVVQCRFCDVEIAVCT